MEDTDADSENKTKANETITNESIDMSDDASCETFSNDLKVKVNEDSTSQNDWTKNRMDDYSLCKTLSPSAASSDTSSVNSSRFDSEFKVGHRIEVKDYRTDTWYNAKVVEVDCDDREIFIHYERWSQRFDEWLKWDSQRIRKIRLPKSNHKFKVGERVLAAWSYTKKYPAVVKSVLPDDKYEVLFYDGFAKILRGNRIAKIDPSKINLMEKMPKEIPRAPPIGSDLDVRNIGTKEERRQKKRRLNVVELLQSNKRRKPDEVLSPQSYSDASPETPMRRRQRRHRRHGVRQKQADEPGDSKSNDEIPTKKRNVNVVNENSQPLVKEENVNQQDSTTDSKSSLSDTKVISGNIKFEKVEDECPVKSSCDLNMHSDHGGNVKKETETIEQPKSGNENENTNASKENDKNSNSKQNFVSFPTDETVKSSELRKEVKVESPVTKSVRIIRKPSRLLGSPSLQNNSVMPMVRRISKRGRIPKLKTSLGNLETSPRLSAFPKIKPRGHMYSENEGDRSRKRRGRQKTKHTTDENDSLHSSSAPDDKISVKHASADKPIKLESNSEVDPLALPKKESPSVASDNIVTNTSNDQHSSDLTNKPQKLVDDSDIPLNVASSNHQSLTSKANVSNAESSVCSQESVSSSNSDSANANLSNIHVKKRGRRMKKNLKKIDVKKSKSWKIISRRKADEDEDPERWNGEIPEGAKPVFIDGGDGKMRQSIIIPDKKLPAGWTKHTIIRKNSSKWDVLLVNPNGRKFRSRKDLRTYYSEMNKDYPEDCFDFVVGRTKATTNLIEMETKKQGLSPPSLKIPNRKREFKRSGSDDSFASLSPSMIVHPDGEKRVKTLMPKTKPPPIATEDESVVSAAAAAAAVSAVTTNTNVTGTPQLPASTNVYPTSTNKAQLLSPSIPKLSVENTPVAGGCNIPTPESGDGTASWQCPKDGCGKHFRKENLLQMHIKHYHPEYNQFLDGAPNVADLAYARTVGEPLDETIGATSFLDRISKYEAKRKAKADTSSGFSKKANISHSPLRKALLKGASKDQSDNFEDSGDFVTKSEATTGSLNGKLLDGLESDEAVDSNFERSHDANERGKLDDADGDYNHVSSSHSTLKELLTGMPALQTVPAGPNPATCSHSSISVPSCLSNTSTSTSKTTCPKIPVDLHEISSPSSSASIDNNLPPAFKISGVSFDDSAPNSPATPTGVRNGPGHVPYRFSKNKPLVTLDKLAVTTDSNDSVTDMNEQELVDVANCTEAEPEDVLKKEEVINCLCGYAEEDGLMIQCDLCLCWQHGFCNNIKKESDVPEKYICSICKNPKKLRHSYKYSYNFDWLKEGKLPVLSFRNRNTNEIQRREALLKQSHDLVATFLELQKVVKSLRLKTHISGKSDHPKLYLWAKSWEKESKTSSVKSFEKDLIKSEDDKKDSLDECKKEKQESIEESPPKGPRAPVPEAPIDLVDCRLRLLEHIEDYQQQVESRLTTLEAQVVALELQDPDLVTDESADFYPQTKQTVQMLMRDLMAVRKVIGLNN